MNGIVKETTSLTYARGETLFHPGDVSSRLYIVHKGRVKIYRLSENGKEQLVRILEPGDFTGELTLFNETTVDTYAEALEKTQLRSEEHTSELQSRFDLVCRLLLEKKK